LHGWGGSIDSFRGAFEHFSLKYRCCALDFYGFGDSELPGELTLDDYAKGVEELIEHYSMRDVVLVGHSFGGRVAMLLAAHSDKIKSIVLVDSAGLKPRFSVKRFCRKLRYRLKKALKMDTSNCGSPDYKLLSGEMRSTFKNVVNFYLDSYLKDIKCDTLIIGGGMAYTFLKAKGYEVGTSLLDEEKLDYCKEMMAKAEKAGKELLLPVDTVVTTHFPEPIDAEIKVETVSADKIPADKMGMDIGEKTRKLYAEKIASAKAVIWNGPMGVFENPTLAKGTIAVAQALADVHGKCTTIIGGGDSAAAVQQLGYADKMSHISTGGGASLELFEGKVLPGIACLNEKK